MVGVLAGAAYWGHLECVRLLLERGADMHCAVAHQRRLDPAAFGPRPGFAAGACGCTVENVLPSFGELVKVGGG